MWLLHGVISITQSQVGAGGRAIQVLVMLHRGSCGLEIIKWLRHLSIQQPEAMELSGALSVPRLRTSKLLRKAIQRYRALAGY